MSCLYFRDRLTGCNRELNFWRCFAYKALVINEICFCLPCFSRSVLQENVIYPFDKNLCSFPMMSKSPNVYKHALLQLVNNLDSASPRSLSPSFQLEESLLEKDISVRVCFISVKIFSQCCFML